MPQRQNHRGQHPLDRVLFAESCWPILRAAVSDLSFLFTRGYNETSALKLVGDHYQLALRQRNAVFRAACGEDSLARRQAHELGCSAIQGRPLLLDGYNLLITLECALSGGILLWCRDGCVRDISGIHGSYHDVEETVEAVALIGQTLTDMGVGEVVWYLDAPISNSGRLRQYLEGEAVQWGWNWRVVLVANPDPVLAGASEPVVSTDSYILNRAEGWVNLVAYLLNRMISMPRIIDLR